MGKVIDLLEFKKKKEQARKQIPDGIVLQTTTEKIGEGDFIFIPCNPPDTFLSITTTTEDQDWL